MPPTRRNFLQGIDMRLITHLWLCLLVAGVCAACTGDDIETPATDGDGDGDADAIVDGDRDDEREIDRGGRRHAGQRLRLRTANLPQGISAAPKLPDARLDSDSSPRTRPPSASRPTTAPPTETCVAASPDWLCVPESLPRWLSGYRFGSTCAWELVAESQSSCAITGVWENAGDPRFARILQRNRNQPPVPLWRLPKPGGIPPPPRR